MMPTSKKEATERLEAKAQAEYESLCAEIEKSISEIRSLPAEFTVDLQDQSSTAINMTIEAYKNQKWSVKIVDNLQDGGRYLEFK